MAQGILRRILSTHPSHGTRIEDIEKWLPQAVDVYRSQGVSSRATSVPNP